MGKDIEKIKKHLKFKDKLIKTASGVIALGAFAGTLASCNEEIFYEPVDIEYPTSIASPIDSETIKPDVSKREPEEIRLPETELTPAEDITETSKSQDKETTKPNTGVFDPFKYNDVYSNLEPLDKINAFAYNFYDNNKFIDKVYLSLELDLKKQEYFTNVTFDYGKQITDGLNVTGDLYYFCDNYLRDSYNGTLIIDMNKRNSLNDYLCENIFRVLKNTYKNTTASSIINKEDDIPESEMTNIQKLDKFLVDYGKANIKGFDAKKNNAISRIAIEKIIDDNGIKSAYVTLCTRGERKMVKDDKDRVYFEYGENKYCFTTPYTLLENLNKSIDNKNLEDNINLERLPKYSTRLNKLTGELNSYFDAKYNTESMEK